MQTKIEIEEILKSLNIKNYIINDNLIVDVDDNVDLYNKQLKEIPVKFGIVTGNFDCAHNKLISLEGAPKIVNGNFDCNDNNLKNLIGIPKIINSEFLHIYDNPNLKSLIGLDLIKNKHLNLLYHDTKITIEYIKKYKHKSYFINQQYKDKKYNAK
jgi:hypothetical protein